MQIVHPEATRDDMSRVFCGVLPSMCVVKESTGYVDFILAKLFPVLLSENEKSRNMDIQKKKFQGIFYACPTCRCRYHNNNGQNWFCP